MPDVTELVKIMKRTTLDAVQAADPMALCYGSVVNTNPLEISVDQKLKLNDSHLYLTRNVRNYETEVLFEDQDAAQKITVCNGLAAGDKVLLLRMQGGQRFIVLDQYV